MITSNKHLPINNFGATPLKDISQSISALTTDYVTVELLHTTVCSRQELEFMINSMFPEHHVAMVELPFFGALRGTSFMLLNHQQGLQLANELSHTLQPNQRFDVDSREVVTEIGTMLLNSYIRVFGSTLGIQLYSRSPEFSVKSLSRTHDQYELFAKQPHQTLTLQISLQVRQLVVNSLMTFHFNDMSFQQLLRYTTTMQL
jgi:chemotaxis protein CheY-P-specific phosphatase CheC